MITNYLALDVGGVRIGLATANSVAQLAAPLLAIKNDSQLSESLSAVFEKHTIDELVIGWPRGLDGQETEQTRFVAAFIDRLSKITELPIHRQDEAVTSVHAEHELRHRKAAYDKSDIDSLSAVYILEDFLREGVH